MMTEQDTHDIRLKVLVQVAPGQGLAGNASKRKVYSAPTVNSRIECRN